jgi:hypothetical protein
MARSVPEPVTVVIAFVVLGILAGCAAGGVEWTKPGATQADFERDWQRCSNLAIGVNPPVFDQRTLTTTPAQQSALQQRNSCMFSRGWQLKPKQ